ncbi:MAG: PAS domain-containing protein [Thermoflexaceae bacterium]|nr:PAS domain-containing protein [Thermoflexaceae bacterium]
MLNEMIKSVLEQDRASIVLCDLHHTIVYMNPSAKMRYGKRGGAALIGKSLMNCHNEKSCEIIEKIVSWFAESPANNMIYTFHNEKENKDVYMVALRDNAGNLIGYYEKHEYRNAETAGIYDFTKSLV